MSDDLAELAMLCARLHDFTEAWSGILSDAGYASERWPLEVFTGLLEQTEATADRVRQQRRLRDEDIAEHIVAVGQFTFADAVRDGYVRPGDDG